jgi:serralysin
MADCSAQEQLMLELVNRARMNPAGEAARFGVTLNQGLAAGTISSAPKQVLGMSDALIAAARNHSNWMLVNDRFDHRESASLPGGRTGFDPDDRMRAAGYLFTGPAFGFGENISWTGRSPGPVNLTSAVIAQHGSLFRSPGHRANILDGDFREIGVGQQRGLFNSGGHNYDSSMLTQNFALSGTTLFVTGVLYNDTKINDNFFSVGEQLAGRAVDGVGVSDATGAGGGYELAFSTPGSQAITFHVSPGVDIQMVVGLGASNVKVDVVNGREIWTNGSLTLTGGPVAEIHALGIQSLALTGSAGSERLFGNAGRNTLAGGDGNDRLDGAAGADHLLGQIGSDLYYVDHTGDVANETGGDGTDTVYSSVTFNLGDPRDAIGDVENLRLTSKANVNAIGNALSNVLVGNAGANRLLGRSGDDLLNGGAGHDVLAGGGGADLFDFSVAVNAANSDRISDFSHADDTIRLQNAAMRALGVEGTLSKYFFHKGAHAHDGNDHIIYNPASGDVFYDKDGTGAQAQVMLVTLTNRPTDLAFDDFLVV